MENGSGFGFFECTPQEREEYRAHLEYVSSINIHDGDYTFRWEDEDDELIDREEKNTPDNMDFGRIEDSQAMCDGSEFIGWGDV